jgi:hypothetical protein
MARFPLPTLLSATLLVGQIPDWAQRLPQADGRLYAVGVASLEGGEAQARLRAGRLARLELVLRLRAQVRGQVQSTMWQTQEWRGGIRSGAAASRYQQLEVAIQATAMSLPALEVQEVAVDEAHGQVFALAAWDLDRAQTVQAEARRLLEARIEASKADRDPLTPEGRLRRFRTFQAFQRRYRDWEEARTLLLTAGVVLPDLDQAGLGQMARKVRLTVAPIENDGLPPELISRIEVWRALRGLGEPRTPDLRLSLSIHPEWSHVLDLDRLRAVLIVGVRTRSGTPLCQWAFESQTVGATRGEALLQLVNSLFPGVQESLDRWFGILPDPPSLKEAS